jgi:protein-tyrosine phosphatase
MNEKYRVLFVCTGNICRSPLAEGYFRHLAEIESLYDIDADSAGTGALPGCPPSLEAIAVAEECEFDISMLKSRRFRKSDLEDFDLVLVMTKEQRNWIIKTFSADESKIKLLREFAGDKTRTEIPDPIGMSISSYKVVFLIIKKSVDALIKHIASERALI